MSPTAAMLVLGHHMKPTPEDNTSPSPSPPVFQVKASAVKWVLDYVLQMRIRDKALYGGGSIFSIFGLWMMEKKF